MTEIIFAAPSGMVAMGMCNDSFIYTFPGIDVKIAGPAVEAFVCKLD